MVAATIASNSCLIRCLSQVGEGGGMASKHRELQRLKVNMRHQLEADLASRIYGQELVRQQI